MTRWTSHIRRAVPLALLLLAACGGGGGGGVGGGGGTPPTSLTYDDVDVVYRAESPIVANAPTTTGGAPTSYAVAPALPTGLGIDDATGVITGTPAAPTTRRTYVVTASNDDGQATTALAVEVRWAAEKSLHAAEALDDADLRHFLIRTQWAVEDDDLAALEQDGLPAFLDGMLVFPPSGSTTWEQNAREILHNDSLPAGQEYLFPSRTQLIRWWLQLMKDNPNAFQEVLAFHWHDHFATSQDVLGGGRNYYMVQHVNMLREKGVGNLRDLLVSVSRDWAMLWWLDGYISTKYNPNENYTREYFELFTLGVDQAYTQEDIVEGSRAFTGYQDQVLDADTGLRHMVFVPNRHDANDKTVLGITIPGQNVTDDYQAMVDLTVDHAPVAEWIARSLLRGFVVDDPDEALVDQVAQVLRDEDYELAPTLRAIFLSEAFFSPAARRSLVKSPVEHALGFERATGLRVRVNELQTSLTNMGNIPTMPPTVDGWPGGQQWLSAHGMVERANLLQRGISDRDCLAEQEAFGLDLHDLLPPGTPTSLEVVDALALRLGIDLQPEERTRLALYLDTERLGDGSVIDDPFDPNDPTDVDERIRGLLYVLGQHPNYMLR